MLPIGFEELDTHLRGLFKEGALPQTLVFQGPQGLGKTTFARHFAAHIISATTGMPVDQVLAQMVAETHEAWTYLAPEEGEGKQRLPLITVEQVRGALQQLQLHTAAGGWRVVVIDALDHLNRFAANILLKSIEEPRPKTLVILINHRRDAALPTLLSRAVRFVCKPLAREKVMAWLAQQNPSTAQASLLDAPSTTGGLDPARAAMLVDYSRGCIGVLADLMSSERLALIDAFEAWVASLPDKRAREGLALMDKAVEPEDMRMLIHFALWWLGAQTTALYQTGAAEVEVAAYLAVWQDLLDALQQAGYYNTDLKQIFTAMVLNIAKLNITQHAA